MKRILYAHVAALALLLLAGTGAKAGPLDPTAVQWSYNFTPGAPALIADNNPTAGVTFTNDATNPAQGKSKVVASSLTVFSTADRFTPDVLINNGNWKLTLQLTNLSEGVAPATLVFTGKITGDFSATHSLLDNDWGTVKVNGGPAEGGRVGVVRLGSYIFTVDMSRFTPPGPPNQGVLGSIGALVTISGAVATVPEPSTILLSSFGLSFLGGAAWRKRRAAKKQA